MKQVPAIAFCGLVMMTSACSGPFLTSSEEVTARAAENKPVESSAGFVDAFPGDDFGNDVGFADDVGAGSWIDNRGL